MNTVKDPNCTPEEEISRLAEKYQLSLLRLCFAYLHDRTLAEDAVHETFLKAYRSITGFRNESSEKTWLSHIAINCCRDMNKSAWTRFFDRRITPDTVPVTVFPERIEPETKIMELRDVVERLPEKLRLPFLLVYMEGYSSQEAASVIGIATMWNKSIASLNILEKADQINTFLIQVPNVGTRLTERHFC